MTQTTRWTLVAALTFTRYGASPAVAGNGKGVGGPGGGSSGGVTPVEITFRDAQDPAPDRIGSDDHTTYVDGVDGVEAFIGSKANSGNLWLRLVRSTRGLWLDFSECVSGDCRPPFLAQIVDLASITVDADDVQADGLLGMSVGTTIYAPARVYYDLDVWNDGLGPGFVEFDPNLGGKNPCKNKSNYVVVTRTGDQTWVVSADRTIAACASLPGGGELAGVFLMPFELTVEALQ